MSTTELVRSLSIENLVNQREAVRQRLTDAREALAEVNAICERVDSTSRRRSLYAGAGALVCSRGDAHGFTLLGESGIADAMKRFDASAWQHLMHCSGIRSLMDATARE